MLAAAREAHGISQREMADRLNWLPSYVGALESNRFDQLRNPNFGRGYLRAYGKLVGVPEAQLMAAYEALPDVDDADKARTRRVKRSVPQVQKIGLAIPAGIAAAVLLVAVLWYLRGDTTVPVPASGAGAEPALAAEPEELAPAAGEQLAVVVADETTAPEPAALEVPESNAGVAPVAPEIAQSTDVDAAPTLVPEVAVDVRPLLSFSFSGACWVEVRNAAAELIYANLHEAGNTLEVRGEAPFDVLVGDARMVTLSYQGEAVPIKSRPGRVIARFTVGEL